MSRTATVGEIQKNFARVLDRVRAGEEVTVTRRGVPVARLVALGPREDIDWPDFLAEALPLAGKPLSEDVVEGREERV